MKNFLKELLEKCKSIKELKKNVSIVKSKKVLFKDLPSYVQKEFNLEGPDDVLFMTRVSFRDVDEGLSSFITEYRVNGRFFMTIEGERHGNGKIITDLVYKNRGISNIEENYNLLMKKSTGMQEMLGEFVWLTTINNERGFLSKPLFHYLGVILETLIAEGDGDNYYLRKNEDGEMEIHVDLFTAFFVTEKLPDGTYGITLVRKDIHEKFTFEGKISLKDNSKESVIGFFKDYRANPNIFDN